MELTKITKNQIVSALTKSPHGSLEAYLPDGKTAVESDPEFYAHLIAWNHIKGQVRDAKAALPVIGLLDSTYDGNAFAHLTKLNPRELLKAYRFALAHVRPHGKMRKFRRLISAYLVRLEAKKVHEKVWLQHRSVLRELYTLAHTKPSPLAEDVIVRGINSPGTIFGTLAELKTNEPLEIAGIIMRDDLPLQPCLGALGEKAKDPDVVMALLKTMTPAQVVNNTKMLERLGVKTIPVLRAAFEEALAEAAKSTSNVLKATRAAEAIEDEELKAKLNTLQEKQLASISVEGDWVVLGDKSGSMAEAIEVTRHVAATLAKLVKGTVHLYFFDTGARHIDVSDRSLEEINKLTATIKADGGTSIGVGLAMVMESGFGIDGIAVVSDAHENNLPFFADVYMKLCMKLDKEPPVYLFRMAGSHWIGDRDLRDTMARAGHSIEEFDLTHGAVDYYSIPNLVQTMRTNRWSLLDEIYNTPLLTYVEG